MTPPIERDERIWEITIKSDACPFTPINGITDGCIILHYTVGCYDEECTFENCPKKSKINGD